MNLRRVVLVVVGVAAVGGAAALLLASGRGQQGTPKPVPYQITQNTGPGSGTDTPLSNRSTGKQRAFDADVRFYDMNGLATSDAVLTTDACSAHGAAQLLTTSMPAVRIRAHRPASRTKTAWAYLCSRGTEEKQWRIHPDSEKLLLSSDGPTSFDLTAADIRKGRQPGSTLLVQCVVCSKEQKTGETPAPDSLDSVIGASEVKTLTLNAAIGPTAAIQSLNGAQVDASRFISSPRIASVVARIRNLPAGTHPYLVTQAFDQTQRWVSLLEPQNGLAGDRFFGAAVLGPGAAPHNFQKYWLTVVVSHRPFQGRLNDGAVAIRGATWQAAYAPFLQSISEEPVVVKRLPVASSAAITLDLDGESPGSGELGGTPIVVDRYFQAFGEVDIPDGAVTDLGRYRTWLLIYREADFGQASTGSVGSAMRQEEGKLVATSWTLPWANLPAEGRYVAVAALTAANESAPKDVSDPRVMAFSRPRLIEWRGGQTK